MRMRALACRDRTLQPLKSLLPDRPWRYFMTTLSIHLIHETPTNKARVLSCRQQFIVAIHQFTTASCTVASSAL
jgi:hypothetical protein